MAKQEPDTFPLLTYIDQLVEELRGDVPKAMKQWDGKAIHQSRVATRRLKAALDLLDPVLSDEHLKPFAKVLKKLRRRLGPMRDLDVMIGHLSTLKSKPHAPAIAWLSQCLDRQRASVRDESTSKGTAARVLSRLGTWWGLREEVEEAREAADSLLAESLHAQLDSFVEQADRLVADSRGSRPTQASVSSEPGRLAPDFGELSRVVVPTARDRTSGPTGPGSETDPHSHLTSHTNRSHDRQDPHAVRIAGKSFRYTLEMAAIQGRNLPPGIMRNFKNMQEALGMWHDYVVLTERALQMSLEELLPHHNADLQSQVLDLARLLLKRSSHHMSQFSKLWVQNGGEVAETVRLMFPLTKAVVEKTGADKPVSNGSAIAVLSEEPAAASV